MMTIQKPIAPFSRPWRKRRRSLKPIQPAQSYIRVEQSKLPAAFIEKMIADPENNFTITPQRTFVYADKLYQLGILKHKAESWKDYFFSEAHTLPGS